VEYIMPRWRHTGTPLAFVGYVFLRDRNDPHGLKDVEELWVGGESRYGFGRLRRVWLEDVEDCFGISINLMGDDPILCEPECVRAHALLNGNDMEAGTWEIVLGWDQSNLSISGLCWVPGSQVKDKRRYRITESGVWESVG
jgi:hypothetical protein